MVAFDYRFEQPGCSLNLSLLVDEAMTIVEWTGTNNYRGYFGNAVIGATELARQDGQWHHVAFNLRDMIRASRFGGKPPARQVQAAELATWATNHGPHRPGYDNPLGASVRIDNFTIYSPADPNPAFAWRAPIPVKGYSFAFDRQPDTEPPATIMTTATQKRLPGVEPGVHYFHVRAMDEKGRWSATAHRRIEVTGTP